MENIFLGIITIALIILTVEVSIVLYYIIVFLRDMVIIGRRLKKLEGNFEEKLEAFEGELNMASVKLVKKFVKFISGFLSK